MFLYSSRKILTNNKSKNYLRGWKMEIFEDFLSGLYGNTDFTKEKIIKKYVKGSISRNEFIRQMEAIERNENEKKSKSV